MQNPICRLTTKLSWSPGIKLDKAPLAGDSLWNAWFTQWNYYIASVLQKTLRTSVMSKSFSASCGFCKQHSDTSLILITRKFQVRCKYFILIKFFCNLYGFLYTKWQQLTRGLLQFSKTSPKDTMHGIKMILFSVGLLIGGSLHDHKDNQQT